MDTLLRLSEAHRGGLMDKVIVEEERMYQIGRRIVGWLFIVSAFSAAIRTDAVGIDEVTFSLLIIAGAILAK